MSDVMHSSLGSATQWPLWFNYGTACLCIQNSEGTKAALLWPQLTIYGPLSGKSSPPYAKDEDREKTLGSVWAEVKNKAHQWLGSTYRNNKQRYEEQSVLTKTLNGINYDGQTLGGPDKGARLMAGLQDHNKASFLYAAAAHKRPSAEAGRIGCWWRPH